MHGDYDDEDSLCKINSSTKGGGGKMCALLYNPEIRETLSLKDIDIINQK
jgi:hypothetical protein